jgi:hypothetical protein
MKGNCTNKADEVMREARARLRGEAPKALDSEGVELEQNHMAKPNGESEDADLTKLKAQTDATFSTAKPRVFDAEACHRALDHILAWHNHRRLHRALDSVLTELKRRDSCVGDRRRR